MRRRYTSVLAHLPVRHQLTQRETTITLQLSLVLTPRRDGQAELTWVHGRNFGLKSGGTNSEGEQGTLGSQVERGKRMGKRMISPPI